MTKYVVLLLAVLLLIVPVCATPIIIGGYPVNASSATSGGGAMINSSYQLVADMIDYYLRDTSLSLTGQSINRDVNNDVLSIYGGTVAPPMGGHMQFYGGDNVALSGGMAARVGDAVGNGISVWWIEGRTNTPFMSMNSHQIKDLLDPTAPQDAATMNYVDTHGGGGSSDAWNVSYFLRDTSRTLTGEKIQRDVDNDLLTLYGSNAIAGGTGGILSLYGKDTVNPNAVEIVVGDGGVGNTLVTGWVGGTTPRMDMNGFNISSLLDPIADQDAATRNWVLVQVGNITISGYIKSDGSIPFTGSQSMGNNNLTNVTTVAPGDAVCKTYVDTAITGINLQPFAANDTAFAANDTELFNNSTLAYLLDGSRMLTGKMDAGGYNLSNIITVAPGDAVCKTYVDTAIAGVGSSGINGTWYILLDPVSTFVGINNPSPKWALDVNGKINATNFVTSALSSGSISIGEYAGKAAGGVNNSVTVGEYAGYPGGAMYQTAIGYWAGRYNQQYWQTAVGSGAGNLNTGSQQTVVGGTSGNLNTGGYQTAMGFDAGGHNVGGGQSVFGYSSGFDNTGTYQSAFGYFSGDKNTGANLVAIGNYSGYQNTGNNVTAIGSNAGRGNAIHNIFILMQREANSVALIQGNFTSGQVQFPNYGTGVAVFDAFGNISSNTTLFSNYVDVFNTSYILDSGYRIFRGNVDHGAWRIFNLTTSLASPMDAVNVSSFNNNVTWTNDSMRTNVSMNFAPRQGDAANDSARMKSGISRKTAIQTILGTATTAMTGISFPIAAYETVEFDSLIHFGSMSLNGTYFSITIPSGAINATMFCPVVKTGIPSTYNESTIVSSATLTTFTCNHEANQKGWAKLQGVVQNANTAGTVQFNIANKRASTLIVNASSYVKWNRMDSYSAGGL